MSRFISEIIKRRLRELKNKGLIIKFVETTEINRMLGEMDGREKKLC